MAARGPQNGQRGLERGLPLCFWHLRPEVEKVVDSASLTRRKYFQKLGLTENIWENIMI